MNQAFAEFQNVVSSLESLREIVREPIAPVLDKELSELDELCCEFLSKSPFLILATSGADLHIDLSPKGDPPGFVRILDNKRLAIPDRPGNRRVDSFQNILENPKVGLLFLIPDKKETLRIRGEARIVRDLPLRESLAVGGKVPELALVVAVETAFMHCPKCMIRSKLWEPESWSEDTLPDIGRVMIQQGKLALSPDELEAIAKSEGLMELY